MCYFSNYTQQPRQGINPSGNRRMKPLKSFLGAARDFDGEIIELLGLLSVDLIIESINKRWICLRECQITVQLFFLYTIFSSGKFSSVSNEKCATCC